MSNFLSAIREKTGRVELALKKNSPEILIVAGAVGVVASIVLACKATLKVEEIKKERQEKLDEIEQCRNEVSEESYSEEDAKKDQLVVNLRSVGRLVKAYAPAGVVLAVSFGLIFKSHGILKSRGAALAAAYTAVDSAFKKYRERAVERFGEEVDKQLRYGIKEEEITVKDGDETRTETVKTADMSPKYSEYAKVFDESSREWKKDAEYNKMYLYRAQEYFNRQLNLRGHLFLNEVYDYLDIPRTRAGQVVGWIKDKSNPDKVSFGIYDFHDARHRAFINGYERSIILDFNVDGVIVDNVDYEGGAL